MNTYNSTKETKWLIDPSHSTLAFKIRHLMIAHARGTFKTFDATIYTIGTDFTSADIDLWIDVSSIDTGDATRDRHLLSPDFFDIEHHKQITFTSHSLAKAAAGPNYELWGELTMRGYAQKIKLDIEFGGIIKDPWGNEKAGFTVTGKIKRSDWGLVWNTPLEAGGLLVGDEVNIVCEVELTRVNADTLTMELASQANEVTAKTL